VRPSGGSRHARTGTLALLLLATAATAPGKPGPAPALPPIVFVSRQPVPDDRTAIPGLGPHHRAVVTGGRLLLREADGRVRELLPSGALLDVSDPSVSPDAHRIAFAGTANPDSGWRIWVVGVDGGGLRQVTFSDRDVDLSPLGAGAERGRRYDDLDPCWVDSSLLVFASTRYPQRAQYADLPVTNLYQIAVVPPVAVRAQRQAEAPPAGGAGPFGRPLRITAERNGAEEPVMDRTRGSIVFARWWFNRYRASNVPAGITTEPSETAAADTVNLWQAMELTLETHRTRLAAADLRSRRGSTGYQPTVLADGSIAAVYAANLGLSPRPAGTGIQVFPARFGPARRLAGAIVAGRAGDAYSGTQGLAPPSACSPVGLPDGRVIFSYSPGARGDFGLYVVDADGSALTRVLDLPGTLELDAAPLVRWSRPPGAIVTDIDDVTRLSDQEVEVARFSTADDTIDGSREERRPPLPATRADSLATDRGIFRFHDFDVFADGPPDSPTRGAAPRTPGTRIRFFTTLARPGRAGGDTAVLVREVAVGTRGEVDERDLPADTPMFEQLVGADGRVLMTAHGPAHVAGLNSGRAGYASRCVGCHLGHSTLPLPKPMAPPPTVPKRSRARIIDH
jgi:hypothetical protein